MAIFARRTHTTEGGHSKLKRRALRGLALAGVAGLSLLAAGCGGGSSGAKVAKITTSSSGKGSASSSDSGKGSARAYSACMRSHGVTDFPDPDSNGRIVINGGVDPDSQKTGGEWNSEMNSPQARKARRACQKLQPNGGKLTTAQQAKDQQVMLTYARCMRSHGVPKFPDPRPDGGLEIGPKVGVDPNTTQFKAAQEICRKVAPGIPTAHAPAASTTP